MCFTLRSLDLFLKLIVVCKLNYLFLRHLPRADRPRPALRRPGLRRVLPGDRARLARSIGRLHREAGHRTTLSQPKHNSNLKNFSFKYFSSATGSRWSSACAARRVSSRRTAPGCCPPSGSWSTASATSRRCGKNIFFVGSFFSGSATNRGLAFPPGGEISKFGRIIPLRPGHRRGGRVYILLKCRALTFASPSRRPRQPSAASGIK